jgi:hypothetical protein
MAFAEYMKSVFRTALVAPFALVVKGIGKVYCFVGIAKGYCLTRPSTIRCSAERILVDKEIVSIFCYHF